MEQPSRSVKGTGVCDSPFQPKIKLRRDGLIRVRVNLPQLENQVKSGEISQERRGQPSVLPAGWLVPVGVSVIRTCGARLWLLPQRYTNTAGRRQLTGDLISSFTSPTECHLQTAAPQRRMEKLRGWGCGYLTPGSASGPPERIRPECPEAVSSGTACLFQEPAFPGRRVLGTPAIAQNPLNKRQSSMPAPGTNSGTTDQVALLSFSSFFQRPLASLPL